MAANKATDNSGDSVQSVAQLFADITTLIRHEIELAKAELAEKVKLAGVGAGILSASAVTGLITLGCLTALAALLMALVIPPWAAVLAVTALWGGATATLAVLGKRKVEAASPFLPEKTIDNVKEDVEWARRRVKRQR